jgi:hypothetical protein
MWPRGRTGRSIGWTISCPAARSGTSARFSASVFPVTVTQSPWRNPRSRRYFITAGVPPTPCRSSCTNLPLGFRSASSGTRSLARWKSVERSSGTPAARAMAIRCSTALVDPPTRHDHGERVLERPRREDVERLEVTFEQRVHGRPARRHSSALPGSSAGSDELYGSVSPSASMATAIVLAVYMPPHAPAPGHAVPDDLEPLLVGDHAREILAVRLERRDDVARLAEREPARIVPP